MRREKTPKPRPDVEELKQRAKAVKLETLPAPLKVFAEGFWNQEKHIVEGKRKGKKP